MGLGQPFALQGEEVPVVDRPDASQHPAFAGYVGTAPVAPGPNEHESVAVGTGGDGDGRLFVATSAGGSH